jgi:glutaredoxin-related protein
LSPKRCRSPKRSPHDSARSLGSHGLGKPIPGKKTLLVPKTAKTPVIAEKKASAVEEISTEIDNSSVEGQSRAINVTDLSVYAGRTLAEKVDSFIDAHPVVMFNRTWCLFSIDAVDFLVNEMRVSVHSLELDVHPKGKEILKYITAKTDHKTTPAIFIRGEFLGGFDQVNALYATGVLERDYLYGLSQADKCDEFLTKSKLSRKPMFWFPETVNAYAIRIGGMITSLSAATAAAIIYWYSWGAYIAYFLALDFFLRVLAGGLISPIGRLAWLFAKCIGNKPRVGRPKQFASCCGLMFAMLGSIFYLLPFYGCNVAGSVFMGGLAIASGMEGFLDFCVGCVIFKFGVQLGAIPK